MNYGGWDYCYHKGSEHELARRQYTAKRKERHLGLEIAEDAVDTIIDDQSTIG